MKEVEVGLKQTSKSYLKILHNEGLSNPLKFHSRSELLKVGAKKWPAHSSTE